MNIILLGFLLGVVAAIAADIPTKNITSTRKRVASRYFLVTIITLLCYYAYYFFIITFL